MLSIYNNMSTPSEIKELMCSLGEERMALTNMIKQRIIDNIAFKGSNDEIQFIVEAELYKKVPLKIKDKEIGYSMSIFKNKETTVTFFELTGNNYVDEHYHDYVETILCTYGKIKMTFTDGSFNVLEPGDAIKIEVGKLHSAYIMENSGCIAVFRPKVPQTIIN